jgi:fumarylpyruvate hydrolase
MSATRPFFFQKPSDAIVPDGATISYPPDTQDLQFEIELVVAIGRGGRDIPADKALDHVYGYAVGIDLTRRDQQRDMRAKMLPGSAARRSTLPRRAGPFTRIRHRPPDVRHNRAGRERRGEAAGRPLADDLERSRDHR